jgi:hypothetical protein
VTPTGGRPQPEERRPSLRRARLIPHSPGPRPRLNSGCRDRRSSPSTEALADGEHLPLSKPLSSSRGPRRAAPAPLGWGGCEPEPWSSLWRLVSIGFFAGYRLASVPGPSVHISVTGQSKLPRPWHYHEPSDSSKASSLLLASGYCLTDPPSSTRRPGRSWRPGSRWRRMQELSEPCEPSLGSLIISVATARRNSHPRSPRRSVDPPLRTSSVSLFAERPPPMNGLCIGLLALGPAALPPLLHTLNRPTHWA